jgi:hypothetical protein
VIKFITLSSPHAGFYCGKNSECHGHLLPEFLNSLIPALVYSEFIQDIVAGAGYWRDPYNLDEFRKGSSSLATLDGERDYNETYKRNFESL